MSVARAAGSEVESDKNKALWRGAVKWSVTLAVAVVAALLIGGATLSASAPGWRVIDGGQGMSKNAGTSSLGPVMAVFQDELYTAWGEQGVIYVSRFDGRRWVSVDGGSGINVTAGRWGATPSMAVFADELYIAWSEQRIGAHETIQVKSFDGQSWTVPDASNGLAPATTNRATNPKLIAAPQKLYLSWEETLGNSKLYVSEYTASGWTAAGSASSMPLNKNASRNALSANMAAIGNQLFVVWRESGLTAGGSSKFSVQAATLLGGVWYEISGAGLDLNAMNQTSHPSLFVLNNEIYVSWREWDTGTQLSNATLAIKRFDGEVWHLVESFPLPGEKGYAITVIGQTVYATWTEASPDNSNQYVFRIAKSNGQGWESIDGGEPADSNVPYGMNVDWAAQVYHQTLIEYDGIIYGSWLEYYNSSSSTVRVARYTNAQQAAAASNTMQLGDTSVYTGNPLIITTEGDRQRVQGGALDETRYVPAYWSSTETGKQGVFVWNDERSQYESSYTPTSAGNYWVTVYFTLQVWNGQEWEDELQTDYKEASVSVVNLVHAEMPQIGTEPVGTAVNQGTEVTLDVMATVGDGGQLSYQWYSSASNDISGGTPISGADSAAYAVPVHEASDLYYFVRVTNSNSGVNGNQTATATSMAVRVVVHAIVHAEAPVISSQSTGGIALVGDPITLQVTASVNDGGELSYQWFYSSQPGATEGTAIPGATSASYAVPTSEASYGRYYVEVTNTNGGVNGTPTNTVKSSIVTLVVEDIPVYGIAPISDQTLTLLREGYGAGAQQTKTIEIENIGNRTLTGLNVSVEGTYSGNFVVVQPPSTAAPSGSPVSFTIRAIDDLPAGTYTVTVTVAGSSMTPLSFQVTQTVRTPHVPERLQEPTAAVADREIVLSWRPAAEAEFYNIYMSTVPGQYNDAATATVTQSTYRVSGLTNGTTYYFVVRAGNADGLGAASNETAAAPANPPDAPTGVTAESGSGRATIRFDVPANHGGAPITGYIVTAEPGGAYAVGLTSPIVVTGLSNGTSYTFTVKAVNAAGESSASSSSNAVVPQIAGGGAFVPLTPNDREQSEESAVEVWVNGKVERAGIAVLSERGGQSVVTIVVDRQKLEDKLALEGRNAVVTIPLRLSSNVVIGELNGQMVKGMEEQEAVIVIDTGSASYTLPAKQIAIDAIAAQIGSSIALEDIKVQIEIAQPSAHRVQVVEDAEAKGSFLLVVPPLDFAVTATYGGVTVDVTTFHAYVERSIMIPDGVDPGRITTGVVVDPDGTVRHMPTRIVQRDGRYYAEINSLTNSTYTVVWHPLEFADMVSHWAKDAVNDMGSRMVVEGTGEGLYSPDRIVTRAEFTTIVVRALGLKPQEGTEKFSDVSRADWFGGTVDAAYRYGLVGGFEDGTFRPDEAITREQAMTIIDHAMKLTGLRDTLSSEDASKTLQRFDDASNVSPWALQSAAANVQAGMVTGRSEDQLAPQSFITRAETATIVQRLLRNSGLI